MNKPRYAYPVILCLVWSFLRAPSGFAAGPPPLHDTGGVLGGLNIASFTGGKQDSIQATATDSNGNIFVAGTTSSPQFSENAAQSVFGESTILRTTDLGATWTRVGNPGNVTVVVPDPVSPQVLFAGGQNGIYKSTDAGQTWQVVYAFPGGYSVGLSMVIDPGNHLRLAAITPITGVLIRSLDGGETWTPGSCPIYTCGQLIADPTGSGALLMNIGGLFISRDWGLTFQGLRLPGPGFANTAAFDPSHPGWIYADVSAGVMGNLWLSTDYGATWTPKASPPTSFSSIMTLAIDPDQPNTLVAVTADGLYRSSDGAASWIRQTGASGRFSIEPDDPFVMVPQSCNPAGGLFAIGSGGPGIFSVSFSPDFGLTWTPPQLTYVTSVASGPACAFYVTRTATSDAFLAKVAPEGGVLWATYLGGSDRETPVAIALDAQGNVYVTGNTSSPDFPVSLPHIGAQGEDSVFVASYSPDGKLIYSATIGGELASGVLALAVDASQNAYITGTTTSTQFPTTPGTLGASLGPGGFVAKLSSDATLEYGSFLGPSSPSAVLVDSNEEAIIAGSGQVPGSPPPASGMASFVMKLDRSASQVLSSSSLPASPYGGGITGLSADPQNNLVVFGETGTGGFQATPGAYSAPQPVSFCTDDFLGPLNGGDAYVLKLRASDWLPIYGALFTAPCGIETGAVALDSSGSAVLAMSAGAGLALRSPLVAGPPCSNGLFSNAIAKLSADGSTLQFATYLDSCGVPGIAVANDGSIYAGVSPAQGGNATSVLHLRNPNPASISLNQISNAFSGDATVVVGGGLYTLAISGFEPPAINLHLNPSGDLPAQLGGVQVKFNGVPATILATAPGQVIVAVPPDLQISPDLRPGAAAIERSPGLPQTWTSVYLLYNGTPSNAVWMPVAGSFPGLLTLDFPNPVYDSNYADGNVRNQDGTQNSATNPAATGSTITLFATGMGATNPAVAPGSIALSTGVSPVTPIFSTLQSAAAPGSTAIPETVFSVPGFVSSLFQIQVQVPTQNLGGTDVGNGVQRFGVGLLFGLTLDRPNFPDSNVVGIYVK